MNYPRGAGLRRQTPGLKKSPTLASNYRYLFYLLSCKGKNLSLVVISEFISRTWGLSPVMCECCLYVCAHWHSTQLLTLNAICCFGLTKPSAVQADAPLQKSITFGKKMGSVLSQSLKWFSACFTDPSFTSPALLHFEEHLEYAVHYGAHAREPNTVIPAELQGHFISPSLLSLPLCMTNRIGYICYHPLNRLKLRMW